MFLCQFISRRYQRCVKQRRAVTDIAGPLPGHYAAKPCMQVEELKQRLPPYKGCLTYITQFYGTDISILKPKL
jgi:hypothetical protein